MTEREKLEKGLWYDANYDAELLEERLQAEDLCFAFNQTRPKETERKEDLLKQLLPHKGEHVTILAPFYTDYGYNCRIGEETFLNHNAYLMDGAPITIGKHCFIGPNCGMYTATIRLWQRSETRAWSRQGRLPLATMFGLGPTSPSFRGSPLARGASSARKAW